MFKKNILINDYLIAPAFVLKAGARRLNEINKSIYIFNIICSCFFRLSSRKSRWAVDSGFVGIDYNR